MAEVIVIGSGVGGLCAAIGAAARGCSVEVLEAADRPGGKAGAHAEDGLLLDTGPSVLTLPEVFDGALALAGEPPLEVVRPERWFDYRFADGVTLRLGRGLEGTLAGVREALGAGPAGELERFLERARRAWEVAGPRFVFGPAPSLRSLAGATPRELLSIQPLTLLWDWIRRDVREPHLQALLARFGTYAGSDARRAPAVLGTIAWVELGLGGFGVRGGISHLVDRLVRAAARLGVGLRCGARVEAVLAPRGRVAGVRLASGEELPARAVICNAEARALFGALLPAPLRRELAGEPSYSGRCVILRAPRAGRPAHAALMPRDHLAELDDLAAGRDPREPTVTVCAPRVAHAQEPWPGEDALFCMVNAPALPWFARPDPEREPAQERAAASALRDRLVAAGVVDRSARPVWWRGPRALAARFPGSGGALYGLASHSWRTAFQRPPNRVPGIPGLYLCGGSAHPGAGLPLVASSGLRAAEALAEDLARAPARRLAASAAAALGAAVAIGAGAAGADSRPGGRPETASASAAVSGPAAAPAAASIPEPAAVTAPEAASPPAAPSLLRARALLSRAEASPGAASAALALVSGDRSPDGLVAAAEAAWRAADESSGPGRREGFSAAVARARLAVRRAPEQAGAWFWLAMALTLDARERGLLALVHSAEEIRRALHEAAERDPGYQRGAPLSALCGLYHRAPGWPLSYGDQRLAAVFCRRALEIAPRSWEAHLVLCRQARERGEPEEARAHLAAILDGPLDPLQPRTHQRYRDEARGLAGEPDR